MLHKDTRCSLSSGFLGAPQEDPQSPFSSSMPGFHLFSASVRARTPMQISLVGLRLGGKRPAPGSETHHPTSPASCTLDPGLLLQTRGPCLPSRPQWTLLALTCACPKLRSLLGLSLFCSCQRPGGTISRVKSEHVRVRNLRRCYFLPNLFSPHGSIWLHFYFEIKEPRNK